MRFMALSLLTFVGIMSNAFAAPTLHFDLNCKSDSLDGGKPTVGAPAYTVRKIVKRNLKKWDTEYALIVKPLNPTVNELSFDLVSNGNGDARYHDFDVQDKKNQSGVSEVTIDDRFEWATLQIDGTVSYKCEE